jgi:hypothetical protein
MPKQIDIKEDGSPLVTGGSNAESYSLDEVKTNGVWFDGKPIYKKTFTVMSPANVNAILSTELFPSGIVDTPIKQEVIMPHSSAAMSVGNLHVNDNTMQAVTVVIKASTGVLNCVVNLPNTSNSSWVSKQFFVTVYYTKL